MEQVLLLKKYSSVLMPHYQCCADKWLYLLALGVGLGGGHS